MPRASSTTRPLSPPSPAPPACGTGKAPTSTPSRPTTAPSSRGPRPGWRCAGRLNCALEADLDRKMPRTAHRPVAAGRLSARLALTQGIVLNLVALTLIDHLTNPLAAALTMGGTLWYVFVYTLWLKQRTVNNI